MCIKGWVVGSALVAAGMSGVPLPVNAGPLKVRMCIFDQPFSPMTFPDGGGQSLELLRRASALQPVAIERVVTPRSQCITRLGNGEVDATLAAFTPDRMAYGAYPMKAGRADPARGVGDLHFSISRRRGGTVQWDGKQFIGLGRQPVGAQPHLLHTALLRQLDVVVDDSGASPEQMFARLAGKHVAAVVTEHDEGGVLIARKYSGEIEMLPTPFQTTPMYLMVSRAFYQRHPAQIEAYWTAIEQVRATSDYQQYLAGFRARQ